MSETAVLNTEELTETADGRFFVPSECLIAACIYDETRHFGIVNGGVLPEVGLVLQQPTIELDEQGVETERAMTITFDARKQRQRTCTWDLTTADKSGRIIRRLEVTPYDTNLTVYQTDAQGRLTTPSDDVLEETVVTVAARILPLVTSRDIKDRVHWMRDRREEVNRQLSQFTLDHLVEVRYEAWAKDEPTREDTANSMIVLALYGKAYTEKRKELSALVDNIRFSVSYPFEPPGKQALSKPVFRDGTLPMELPPPTSFPKTKPSKRYTTAPSEAREHQLALLPADDFAFDAIRTLVLDRRAVLADPERAREALTAYRELSSTRVEALSSYEQAQWHVARHVALSSLRRAVHSIHDRDGAWPQGLYRLGNSIYRRDSTGHYVVGTNWLGIETYQTLVRFRDPNRYGSVATGAWANLVQDVLLSSA